jgi:2-polyprenyl-3-methyl-5-hydroxy-6-metoxy-1,4-benzoquinol methylase
MTGRYNLTHLNLDMAEERGIVHRDYIAHCLRWSHVLKYVKVGMKVLDVGCGPEMPLASVLYVNRYKPSLYVGIDLRPARPHTDVNFEWFHSSRDVTQWRTFEHLRDEFAVSSWDLITCLEVLEHMPHDNGRQLLSNLAMSMTDKTTLVLSTPCFNGSAAGNHTAIDGTPMEWTYHELKAELERRFDIYAHYGTFASQSDLRPAMSPAEVEVFSALREYYDSNLLSVMLAPLHPSRSRNVVWDLRKKA